MERKIYDDSTEATFKLRKSTTLFIKLNSMNFGIG